MSKDKPYRGVNSGICPLCGKHTHLTKHHVFTKANSDAIIKVCRKCHDKLHPENMWIKRKQWLRKQKHEAK